LEKTKFKNQKGFFSAQEVVDALNSSSFNVLQDKAEIAQIRDANNGQITRRPQPIIPLVFLNQVLKKNIAMGLYRNPIAILFNPPDTERINTSTREIDNLTSYYNLQNIIQPIVGEDRHELFSTQLSDKNQLKPVGSIIATSTAFFRITRTKRPESNIIEPISNTKRKNEIENNCLKKKTLIDTRLGKI
jgi:hypothetical protein